MELVVTRASGKNITLVEKPTVTPRKESLCFVLHGFQLPQHNYQNDLVWFKIALKFNGIPSTVRLKIFEYVELTKPIQEWYFYKVFFPAAKGTMTLEQAKRAWNSFWLNGRAFDDGLSPSQGRIDWINNPTGQVQGFTKFMQKARFLLRSLIKPPEGIGMNKIVCSGAIHEMPEYPRIEHIYGEDCYKIATFNSAHMDFTATPATHPYQFFYAMNATRDGRIENFPQLGMLPIPTPIISRNMDYDYIPCDRVRVLSQTEPLPPPYYPPR